MIGLHEDVGKQVVQGMEDDGIDTETDQGIDQWLGSKIRWGGLECNRMTREFYRVVSRVEELYG